MRKGLSISIRLGHILLAGGWMGWAGTPTAWGQLRIEVIAAYNLVVDSNVESPSTYAPRAAYLGATYHNDGTNALTDVVAAIDAAEDEIYFALNKVTREGVADALIRACDRGVTVHGTIPKSDRTLPGQDSYEVYRKLRDAKNYATRNRVRLYDAYYDAARSRYDNGSRDLVHAKYMVVDPRGANPLAIHGSANWTASGLVLTASNDENVQFLPHRGIAQALAAQFAAMTDGMKPWCSLRGAGTSASVWLDYWLPDDGAYELEWSEKIGDGAAWNRGAATLPVGRGTNAAPVLVERPASRRFYRIRWAGPGESR